MNRFFIRDCNGNIIGNPKGYRTHRGAMQQAGSVHGKAYKQAWEALRNARDVNPSIELIYSIKLQGD